MSGDSDVYAMYDPRTNDVIEKQSSLLQQRSEAEEEGVFYDGPVAATPNPVPEDLSRAELFHDTDKSSGGPSVPGPGPGPETGGGGSIFEGPPRPNDVKVDGREQDEGGSGGVSTSPAPEEDPEDHRDVLVDSQSEIPFAHPDRPGFDDGLPSFTRFLDSAGGADASLDHEGSSSSFVSSKKSDRKMRSNADLSRAVLTKLDHFAKLLEKRTPHSDDGMVLAGGSRRNGISGRQSARDEASHSDDGMVLAGGSRGAGPQPAGRGLDGSATAPNDRNERNEKPTLSGKSTTSLLGEAARAESSTSRSSRTSSARRFDFDFSDVEEPDENIPLTIADEDLDKMTCYPVFVHAVAKDCDMTG